MSTELTQLAQNTNLLKILIQPHTSEKSSFLHEKYGQHVFEVLKDANKYQIKQAVELLFKVKVHSVRVVNLPAKTKHYKQIAYRQKNIKKAYVRLHEGFDINLMGKD